MYDTAASSISSIQDNIISEFQALGENKEDILTCIVEVGDRLPAMKSCTKTEHTI